MTPGGDDDRIDADPRWKGIDAEACYRYTLRRQTKEGGFCFDASPEWRVAKPNAPDTHAAVAILHLFGRPVPRVDECVTWLKAQQDAFGGFPTLVIGFAILKALRILGSAPRSNPCCYLQKQGDALWPAGRDQTILAGWLRSPVPFALAGLRDPIQQSAM